MHHTSSWAFTELYGMAFGLAAAVLNFNRLPTLFIAAARRIGATIAAAYFDDFAIVDPYSISPTARRFNTRLWKLFGIQFQEPKGYPSSTDRVFLGASIRLGSVSEDGRGPGAEKRH